VRLPDRKRKWKTTKLFCCRWNRLHPHPLSPLVKTGKPLPATPSKEVWLPLAMWWLLGRWSCWRQFQQQQKILPSSLIFVPWVPLCLGNNFWGRIWKLVRSPGIDSYAGILEQFTGDRNGVGISIWLSYRTSRLHGLAESIPWNWFLESLKVIGSLIVYKFGLWLQIIEDNLQNLSFSPLYFFVPLPNNDK
jgi:hypothetical protein